VAYTISGRRGRSLPAAAASVAVSDDRRQINVTTSIDAGLFRMLHQSSYQKRGEKAVYDTI
jgi:hypothetical protein